MEKRERAEGKRDHCPPPIMRTENLTRGLMEARNLKDMFLVRNVGNKGRGVFLKSPAILQKDSYVFEYEGDIISAAEADARDEIYSANGEGCFIMYFTFKGMKLAIDATRKFDCVARLVNHSRLPNIRFHKPLVIDLNSGLPRIAAYALRDIKKGEEIVMDYGIRDSEISWLKNSEPGFLSSLDILSDSIDGSGKNPSCSTEKASCSNIALSDAVCSASHNSNITQSVDIFSETVLAHTKVRGIKGTRIFAYRFKNFLPNRCRKSYFGSYHSIKMPQEILRLSNSPKKVKRKESKALCARPISDEQEQADCACHRVISEHEERGKQVLFSMPSVDAPVISCYKQLAERRLDGNDFIVKKKSVASNELCRVPPRRRLFTMSDNCELCCKHQDSRELSSEESDNNEMPEEILSTVKSNGLELPVEKEPYYDTKEIKCGSEVFDNNNFDCYKLFDQNSSGSNNVVDKNIFDRIKVFDKHSSDSKAFDQNSSTNNEVIGKKSTESNKLINTENLNSNSLIMPFVKSISADMKESENEVFKNGIVGGKLNLNINMVSTPRSEINPSSHQGSFSLTETPSAKFLSDFRSGKCRRVKLSELSNLSDNSLLDTTLNLTSNCDMEQEMPWKLETDCVCLSEVTRPHMSSGKRLQNLQHFGSVKSFPMSPRVAVIKPYSPVGPGTRNITLKKLARTEEETKECEIEHIHSLFGRLKQMGDVNLDDVRKVVEENKILFLSLHNQGVSVKQMASAVKQFMKTLHSAP